MSACDCGSDRVKSARAGQPHLPWCLVVKLERLASAEAVLREIAAKGCIMRALDTMPDCAPSLPDGFLCGPCRARRWREGQR